MKNIFLLFFLICIGFVNKAQSDLWPQFRGIKGSGIASETSKPPISFGNENLLWELELPSGVSSPVIWKEKLFITGYVEENKKLTTYCINRLNGEILWEKTKTPEVIEKVHPISSPAQSSVVTDGENIVTFYGSYGLVCYKMNGEETWSYPTPFPVSYYGNAPSPVIVEDKVIMSIDFGNDRFLVALNIKNGNEIWKTKYINPELPNDGASATPFIINDVIIVNKSMEVAAYSAINGNRLWGYPILNAGNSSPIISGNKAIFPCWFQLGEEETRGEIPTFDIMLQKYDADNSKTLVYSEFPDNILYSFRPEAMNLEGTSHSLKEVFGIMDQNTDKAINQNEWETSTQWMKSVFYKPSELIAIDIDSKGELSDSSVLWRISEGVPEVPTPICYQDRVYIVKDGGIVTCLNPLDGHILFKENLGNRGPYICSPIAANGMIYLFSYNGKMSIIKASDKFEVVGRHDFKNKILATPAIIGNVMYIRAGNKLLAFSE